MTIINNTCMTFNFNLKKDFKKSNSLILQGRQRIKCPDFIKFEKEIKKAEAKGLISIKEEKTATDKRKNRKERISIKAEA